MPPKGNVREYDEKMAVLVARGEYPDHDQVLVQVGDNQLVLRAMDWDRLPPWDGSIVTFVSAASKPGR